MSSTTKLDALTSLRFFAAAMIVLEHSHRLFGSFGAATTFPLAQGVSFFFVLSGFILTYNYPVLKTPAKMAGFFKARVARIWPAHLAAIALLFILTGNFNIEGLTQGQVIFTALANLFLIQSFIPLRDVFFAFNAVAWSISTEMFFYLAFPLLITGFISGWKLKLIFLALLVALFCGFSVAWSIPADEAARQVSLAGLLYVNPLVRVFEFFIGILACAVFMRVRASSFSRHSVWLYTLIELLVIALAVLSLWFTPRLTGFLGWQGPVADVVNFYLTRTGSFLPFAVLIVVFALGKGRVSRLLSATPLILLGEISFSLYLVHMTILNWYENNLAYFSGIPNEVRALGYWLLAIMVAFLLHKAIENPCRKLIMSYRSGMAVDALKGFFSMRHVAYMLAMVFLLLGFKQLPAAFTALSCATDECELIVKSSALPVAGHFSNYVSLLAVRSTTPEQGGRLLELVFEVNQPLPDGYHLAAHLIDRHAEIVTQVDFHMDNTKFLSAGERFVERIEIPARSFTSNITGLGLAIYNDPSSPLPVAFARTDYNGRRMLIDLSSVDAVH